MIPGRNINTLRYADDTTLITESEEELKSLLMKVKSESEVAQSCPTLSGPMDYSLPAHPSVGFPRQEYWSGLPFLPPGDLPDPEIEPTSPVSSVLQMVTADMKLKDAYSLEGKFNIDNILKSRDITLPTKVHLVKAIVFAVVVYGCESWTVKKAER